MSGNHQYYTNRPAVCFLLLCAFCTPLLASADELNTSSSPEAQRFESAKRQRLRAQLLSYVSSTKFKVDRAWQACKPPASGKLLITKVQLTVDTSGKMLASKILKGSGSSEEDQSAQECLKGVSFDPLPAGLNSFDFFFTLMSDGTMNLAEYTQSTEPNDYYNKILGVSVSTGGGFIGSLGGGDSSGGGNPLAALPGVPRPTVLGGGAPRLGGGSGPAPWPAPSRASHGGGAGVQNNFDANDRPNGRPSVAAQADVDFGPYMADVQRRLKGSWFPPQGFENKRVGVVFKVHRDGYVSNLRLEHSSGVAIADQAALEAVRSAAPLHRLPAGAADDVDIQFTFDLNAFNGGGVGKFTRF